MNYRERSALNFQDRNQDLFSKRIFDLEGVLRWISLILEVYIVHVFFIKQGSVM